MQPERLTLAAASDTARTQIRHIRICYALRMIRAPRRWRPLLSLALAIGLVSCTFEPPPPASPLQLAGIRASTIVVAPFNIALPLPDELKASTTMVSEALVEHLQNHGKTVDVFESSIGHALWIESTEEVRNSGGVQNFETAVRVLARKVREKSEFDAFIIPSIYVQNARLNADASAARWDGANQRIEFVGRSRWEIEFPDLTTIAAASLLVHVLDPEGNTIHTKRTGLELIQHMEIRTTRRRGHDKRTWSLVDDSPSLEDRTRVGAAIAHVLSPFLPKEGSP